MSGDNIILLERFIVAALLIASVVSVLARSLRVPYTVGLVLICLEEKQVPEAMQILREHNDPAIDPGQKRALSLY